MRRRALVGASVATVVVLLVGIGAVVLDGDNGPDVAEARLEVDGRATVAAPDGSTEEVTDSKIVDFGETVTVVEGTASLELAGGERYELRSGGEQGAGSEVLVGSPPTLLAGDVLVAGGFPAAITHDSATVSAQGALKVQSGVPLAAAYAGRTRINGAGDLDQLLGLRQVVLTPSASPEPFVYDPTDDWDRRFLAEAIAFGKRLEALARGYSADLQPGGGRSVSFFESVLPPLADEREFSADLLDPDRPVGETLVGAAIVVQGRMGTFRERWDEVFAFRAAGAEWGLVALDQGVSSAPVLDTIELALEGSPLSGDPRPSTTTTTRTVDSSPGDPGDTPTTTTTATTTTTTTTTTPPGILEPVVDPVDELLAEVLETLGLGG